MAGLPYIVEGPIGTNATPTTTIAHTHAVVDITGLQAALDGKQASGSYAPASGIAPAAITGTAVITNDSRLSDSRTPTAHKTSHATGGTDALTPSDIGASATGHSHTISDVTGLETAIGGAGIKAGVQWTDRHTTSTGNPYLVGSIVYNAGRVYRCIAQNDSISPEQGGNPYWADLGVGYLLPNENPKIKGGSIDTRAGAETETSLAGGNGGTITLKGGDGGFLEISGGIGGNSGSINLSGYTVNSGDSHEVATTASVTVDGLFGSAQFYNGIYTKTTDVHLASLSIATPPTTGPFYYFSTAGGIRALLIPPNVRIGGDIFVPSHSVQTSEPYLLEPQGIWRIATISQQYFAGPVVLTLKSSNNSTDSNYIPINGWTDGAFIADKAIHGGHGGSITLMGGYGSASAGSINLNAGSGGNNHGGSIISSGSRNFSGGTLNMSAGEGDGYNGTGGSIDTSNGGGSINTRGVGSIQLGVDGTRTTLVGSASESNQTITFPDATGTIALTNDSRFTDPMPFTFRTSFGITAVGNSSDTRYFSTLDIAEAVSELQLRNFQLPYLCKIVACSSTIFNASGVTLSSSGGVSYNLVAKASEASTSGQIYSLLNWTLAIPRNGMASNYSILASPITISAGTKLASQVVFYNLAGARLCGELTLYIVRGVEGVDTPAPSGTSSSSGSGGGIGGIGGGGV